MKPEGLTHLPEGFRVAPRTGAWIETYYCLELPQGKLWSPPARGRGLKLVSPCSPHRRSSRPPHGGVD